MNAVKTFRDLGLGLWVGGIAAIDFVEAPARFRTPDLDRNAITAVGRSVFRAFSQYELGVAAATATLSLLAARSDERGKTTAVLTGAMLVLSLVQGSILHPKMRDLQETLDFVNRDDTDPRYAEHRKYHGAYMAVDGVKFLLGLAAEVAANSHRPTTNDITTTSI